MVFDALNDQANLMMHEESSLRCTVPDVQDNFELSLISIVL